MLQGFKDITGYDIEKYLNDFSAFIDDQYGSIVNYYNGSDLPGDSFQELDRLKLESEIIESLFELYSEQFDLTDYWTLMDLFSDTQVKISTIENLGRWLRSSRTTRFDSSIKLNYVQKQGESMERISRKAGYQDSDNDWVKLSIENDQNEEKYTSAGGMLLTISLSNRMNFNMRNIVDNLSELNIYGKDIKKKFTITNEDIETLSGETSLLQTFETILEVFKGSIPEFPELGIDSNIIGSNVSAVNYPAVFKSLSTMFQRDDRFRSIDVLDINRKEDQIYMTLQARTKLGDVLQNDILI